MIELLKLVKELGPLGTIRDLVLSIKVGWCYFFHIEHHINDETIMHKDGEIKWYCTKCKKGWRE